MLIFLIQTRLPEGTVPLCLLLYSDKSHLSSFGTAKSYPAIARCLNLPMSIRNARGTGGGRIVALLPVVHDTILTLLDYTYNWM